jgi:hypothetical protein
MDNIKKTIEYLEIVFAATEEVLSEWNWEEQASMQVATLMNILSPKLSLTEKQARDVDHIVRLYIKNDHPVFYLSQGAHGGIKRLSDKGKKILPSGLKAAIEADIRAQIMASLKTNEEASSIDDE